MTFSTFDVPRSHLQLCLMDGRWLTTTSPLANRGPATTNAQLDPLQHFIMKTMPPAHLLGHSGHKQWVAFAKDAAGTQRARGNAQLAVGRQYQALTNDLGLGVVIHGLHICG